MMNKKTIESDNRKQVREKKTYKKIKTKTQHKHNGRNILDFFGKSLKKPVVDVQVKIGLKSKNLVNLKPLQIETLNKVIN